MHDLLCPLKAEVLNFDFEEVIDSLRQVYRTYSMVSASAIPMLSQWILFSFLMLVVLIKHLEGFSNLEKSLYVI